MILRRSSAAECPTKRTKPSDAKNKNCGIMKDPSCPRPAGFRLCYRSADKESHRTAEAPPASTQPQNGEILRRGERHFVSAAEHASRPRLFFCASSPVSKKAIEWPPSGTKIKKLRNGESSLSRLLCFQNGESDRRDGTRCACGAVRDTSCPRPAGFRLCYRSADKESHRTAEAPPASTQPQNGEILRRGERHFVSAAEHASRPRLFFCASSPVSKKP